MDRERRDFFISYTFVDEEWAEWIAHVLEEAGYSVSIQAWDFRPGSNFVIEMQRELQSANKVIAVLTRDYLAARFPQPEWAAAFASDPEGLRKRLIPVMVEPCEPDGLLSQVVQIRLHGLNPTDARRRLLDGVREGRAKPSKPPRFPGARRVDAATPQRAEDYRIWRRASAPPRIEWRADLEGRSPQQLGHQAIELHIVPVGDEGRLQANELRELATTLPAVGRQSKLFSATEAVDVQSDANSVVVTATGREMVSGLAVTRSGQRSAWQSLPRDMLGAVVDEEHAVDQISVLLNVLAGMAIPTTEEVVPFVGIEPAQMVVVGRVSDLPRSHASLGISMPQHIRPDAEDMVTFADLRARTRDVALELAARLVANLATTRTRS